MSGFVHNTPAFRTFAGDRALAGLGRELRRAQLTRVVLIGSASAMRAAAVERLRAALGTAVVGEFARAREHSPIPVVEGARDVLREAHADAVVVVGGGSSVVTARAAVILLAEDRDLRVLASRRDETGVMVSPRLEAPKLPIWIVPTTPTTAYAKAGSAVSDPETGERLPLFDPKTRARGVAFDPGFASTAPDHLVRSASLNAFSLAVEGLHAAGADPLADALLAHGLRLALEWLPRVGDDPCARLELMSAALLSGQGSDFARGGLAQGLSHTIGPRSSVANGVVEAMLVPTTTRLDEQLSGTSRHPLLSSVLGLPVTASTSEIADALQAFLHDLEVPSRLREVGVARDDLPALAAHAADDWAIASRPAPPGAGELLELLVTVW